MPTKPDPEFKRRVAELESAYLASDDPIEQSGFHGGRRRWIEERSPLIEAIHRSGSFLDVGCANGLLVADVVVWARKAGFALEPHGVDVGEGLIALARGRHRGHEEHFVVADAWEWEPERRWTYVYSLLDLSPDRLWCEWLGHLTGWVEEGGRLIIGSYGSRSRGIEPVDVARTMTACGLKVTGRASGGRGPVSRFAWMDC